MKTSVKYALSAAILAAGGVASVPAFADTYLPDTGNGELVLYVRNVTTDTTYVRGLGVRIDDLLTQSAIASSGYAGVTQDRSSTISIGSLIHDNTLATFLGSNPVASNFEWGVLAGDSTYTPPSAVRFTGDLRYISTTQQTLGGTVSTGGQTNSRLNSVFGNLIANTQTPANGAINTGILGDKASGIGPVAGIYSPNAAASPQDWYGAGLVNASNLGQTANLYLLATNGTATGINGGNGTQAQVYKFASITLNLAGDLSSAATSAVPLPAAVWLLGSGLVGLAGIGRRRRSNVV